IKETGTTFKENAALKAEQIATLLQIPVIGDDSGLEIKALGGRPGVYSARYAGIHKSDQANIDKVLSELIDVPMEKRQARFVCMLAIATPDGPTVFKDGYCESKIDYEQKGSNGFGYEPIFLPTGYTKTLAQLTADEKNQISHRKKAFVKIETWLNSIIGRGL